MDEATGPDEATPRGRPRGRLGRPSTLDRDAALKAARDVIAARGFDRTRYSDVAEASGVPVTTLQHAFGSLQAMLLESVQRTAASEIAILRDLSTDTTLTPWERLSEFVAGAVHPPDEPDSWLLWLEFWRLAGRDADVGAKAGVIYEQWWDYVAELITLGAAAGEFTGAICATPREAAIATVAMIDGIAAALIVRADGPDHERTRALAMDAIASMLGHTGR
ncbi:MAG: TetR/AcrR family transcriptional regulator [Solirubrobacteraceae bacterium]